MESCLTTTTYFSTMGSYDYSSNSDDLSTGYLEDALYGDRSKRRRSLLYNIDDDDDREFQKCWNSNSRWEWGPLENFNCTTTTLSNYCNGGFSSESRSGTWLDIPPEIPTPMAAMSTLSSGLDEIVDCSSSSFKLASSKSTSSCTKLAATSDHKLATHSPEFSGENRKRKKRVVMKRLVYPFALVKPGGAEGDITLNDINERILMPPTRPVRHPVGDFAGRPTCLSPHGPGLSGKAVVGLTRIHTQGRRGTITIIRTKG